MVKSKKILKKSKSPYKKGFKIFFFKNRKEVKNEVTEC